MIELRNNCNFDYSELLHVQKQLNTTLDDLKALQDNSDSQSSNWAKEKSELQVTKKNYYYVVRQNILVTLLFGFRLKYHLYKKDYVEVVGK